MEIKRTTEIFVETNRRIVVRQPECDDADAQVFCPRCRVQMLAAEHLAVAFAVSCRAVYRLAEAGATHFTETETGALLVCPNSLAEILGDLGEKP